MPWTEESLIRLALELPGGQLAADLRAKLVSVDGALRQLKDTYTAGSTPVDEYIARSSKLLRQQQDLTEQLGTLERAEREHASAVANSAQGASAWGAAIAEGTRRATEASTADARLAAANRDLTTAFGQNAGSASSWGAAIADGTRRAQDFADRTARATGGLHAWDALMAQAPLTASRAASGTDAWVALMGKSATTTDTAGKSVDSLTKFLDKNKWGVLEAGRAVQDFSAAGLMGMVNNIERLVTGFGGTINLATTLTLVGVAAQALAPVFVSAFKSMFSEGVEPAANRLEALKRQLKEMEEKPHKIALDLLNIEYVQKQVEKLQRDMEAFEALRNKQSTTNEKVGAGVTEAITEFAGGGDQVTGAQNLRGVLFKIAQQRGELGRFAPEDAGRIEAIQRQLASLPRLTQSQRASGQFADLTNKITALEKELADRSQRMVNAAEKGIGDLIAQASKGSESARAELERVYSSNRAAFRGAGIDDRFGAGLVLASRTNVEAGDRERSVIARQRQMDTLDAALTRKAQEKARSANDDLIAKNEAIMDVAEQAQRDREMIQRDANDQELARRARVEREAKAAEREREQAARKQPRLEREAKLRDLAEDVQGATGASDQAAMTVARRAVALHEHFGIPMQAAANQAYFELQQQMTSIEQRYAMMANQWGMNQQRAMTMRDTFLPY